MPVELISLIKPKTSGGGLGQFPMVEDVDFLGGFQARADILDRDSIYPLNRKEGMHVYVISLNKTYRLGPGLTNLDWVEVSGGGGTSVAFDDTEIAAAAFVYSGITGLSTFTIPSSPSSDAGLLKARSLWRNGVLEPTMVTGTPAADGEWRLNGTTLEVFGDVTGSGDDYYVRYPV
jgi:hypothetical protein